MRSTWVMFCGTVLLATVGCGASDADYDVSNAEKIRAAIESGGSGAAAEAALPDPTGWGSIKGTITFSGAVPARSVLQVTKDVEVCAADGKKIYGEEIVVDEATKGLANVIVYLDSDIPSDDPKWEHESYAATRDAELTASDGFDQKECIFLSHVFVMRSTQTVEILNSDPIGHNTKIDARSGAQPINESIPAGGSLMYAPGGESKLPIDVTCSIHPWMKAYLFPRDNPYFGVSGKTGTYEIANIPAGVDLEFRIWHEGVGYPSEVTINGEKMALKKGRFEVNLADGEIREMNIVFDSSVF